MREIDSFVALSDSDNAPLMLGRTARTPALAAAAANHLEASTCAFFALFYHAIFQAPGHVVLLTEMMHEARIIPLDGRPAVGAGVRQWLGSSRG